MKLTRSDRFRKVYDVDNHYVVFEYYAKPPRPINAFATLYLEMLQEKCLRRYRYTRIGAAIAINKATQAIDALCTIYVKRTYRGLCVGNQEGMEAIKKALMLSDIKKVEIHDSQHGEGSEQGG